MPNPRPSTCLLKSAAKQSVHVACHKPNGGILGIKGDILHHLVRPLPQAPAFSAESTCSASSVQPWTPSTLEPVSPA